MQRKLKLKFLLFAFILILIILFMALPMFEMKTDKKLYAIRYKDDFSEFETNECYDESYYYNEKHKISIYNFNHKKFLFLNFYSFDYKKGNVCETEYQLEEDYINDFIEKANITYNSHNINLATLVEGKTPIVGNSKYVGNDYNTIIEYTLNNKEEIMYIFYKYDLLIIQVGSSDEGPKFIAYK